jgi:membrane associated rhomboid family serine protease
MPDWPDGERGNITGGRRVREAGLSFEALSDVNYLAVLVAAVAYFVLGAVWYANPIIAKAWQRAGGIEVSEDQGPNPAVFGATFVCYFVAGLATAMLVVATGTDSAAEGAVLGLVVGVGYAVTASAVSTIYDRKPEPFAWFWINGVYNLAALVGVGAILGAWT